MDNPALLFLVGRRERGEVRGEEME